MILHLCGIATMSSSYTKHLFKLISFLLFVAQSPYITANALTAPSPRDSECFTLEKTSGWQAAHDYHLKCKNYHQGFFKPTASFVKPMDFQNWYTRTITRLQEENPYYSASNVSEVEVFAREMAGDGDFRCSMMESSCNRKFGPRQIINHLADMNPEWEPQRLMEEAQKASRTLDAYEIIHRIHHLLYVGRDPFSRSRG